MFNLVITRGGTEPDGIETMELRNLDTAIVNVLGDVRSRKGPPGYTNVENIFENFADIPAQQLEAALHDLHQKQMIRYTPDGKTIFLTGKGVDTLQQNMLWQRMKSSSRSGLS